MLPGGTVKEFPGAAVEGMTIDQFQVEVGGTGEDRCASGLAADHPEDRPSTG